MRSKNIIIIFTLVFIIGIFVVKKNIDINKYDKALKTKNNSEEVKIVENTTLSFVGDIMLTRGVENSVVKNFNGDYNKLFENIPELKDSDILFGNLEGAVSSVGNNVGSQYSFRMDPLVLPALKNAGFDIVSFANNHVGDWNTNAFLDTLSRLDENKILKTGAGMNKEEASNPTIIEKNGVKFGFLGFSDVGPNWIGATTTNPGILLANDSNLEEIIRKAKAKTDVLITSFHFGEEYKTTHNKRQEYLAHTAIDNGADMVIGHHPHVMQDIEEYKDKIIIYSLGNFIFDQNFSKNTMRGMLFSATFKNKNLIKTEQKIITLNSKYQPEGIFSIEEVREKDDLASSICPKPKKDYVDMMLLNIGQIIGLPDITYIPENLRELNKESSTKSICLIKEARDLFELMAEEAKKDDYIIKVSSGYRSYEYQKNLLENAIKNGKKDASILIAKPGYSEHQLGTAVDITGASIDYSSADNSFLNSVESIWLEENAYKYGFVMSYPFGKENITGYKHEPWHYRYVGIENAKNIKDSDITITEFLE